MISVTLKESDEGYPCLKACIYNNVVLFTSPNTGVVIVHHENPANVDYTGMYFDNLDESEFILFNGVIEVRNG